MNLAKLLPTLSLLSLVACAQSSSTSANGFLDASAGAVSDGAEVGIPVSEAGSAVHSDSAWVTTDLDASSSTTGQVDVGGTALAQLSDNFVGPNLNPSWLLFNTSTVNITVGGGLHLQPTASLLWFDEQEGALLYKLVSGDFKVSSVVHARSAMNPQAPPSMAIHLGGLMARSGGQGQENYVFVVLGFGEEGSLSVEIKDTVNGVSTFADPAWPSDDAELRLCRYGSSFALLKRAVGSSTWLPAGLLFRPDLPATLQVGPNVYAMSSTPDLMVTYDAVIFAANTSSRAGCLSD